jgi:phage-related protein
MTSNETEYRRRWRFYETERGNRPARDFLDGLPASDAAEIVAEMKQVAKVGLEASRHLRGDVWEVRVQGENRLFRVIFAPEGRFGQVLLALEAFIKKTQKTPRSTIALAEKRLSDWRRRGAIARRGG